MLGLWIAYTEARQDKNDLKRQAICFRQEKTKMRLLKLWTHLTRHEKWQQVCQEHGLTQDDGLQSVSFIKAFNH